MTESELLSLEKRQMKEWDETEHSVGLNILETWRCPKCRMESVIPVKQASKKCLNPACHYDKRLTEKVVITHPRKH